MRLLIKIAVPCLLVVAAIYGCVFLILQNIPVRFRLTIEVKDGEQIRTGSSVLEVGYPIGPDSLNTGTSSFRRVIGYAVTVDLGQKGLLFLTFFNAHRTSKQVTVLQGQAVEPLDRGVQQFGVGREGDGLGLHRGVDRNPRQIARA